MKQFYRLCGVWATTLFLAFSASAQSTYYVKANASGSNNGTSWSNAFTDLQSAIDVAVGGDQIWVAAGTYKPTKDMAGSGTPADARTKTFVIKNGVKLYGGFAGTETTLGQRNEIVNATVLSGDLNGNDGSNFSNNSENVYHVMVANAITTETVLDGFIITGGNANLTSAFLGMVYGHQYGGGLISSQVNTSLVVTRCIFKGNYAGFGGGAMQLYYSEPVITGCVFTENSVGNSYGGAMYFDHGSPVISNSVFAGNKSNYEGGALYVFNYSSPVIVNSTFAGNYANTNGGAVYVRNSCTVNIKNAIIWGNTGGGAQAIANEGTASISVTHSDVQGGYTGTANINADPVFNKPSDADGSDNLWRTADDGLALRISSPAANTGNNASIPAGITNDIVGDARILNTTVNMGAYEALLPAVRYYVRATASGSNDGSSWSNAFTDLQSAIDVAVGGDEIWVAAGTYKPTKDITGSATPADARTKTFAIRNGVKLYGGFAGTEATLGQRNEIVNATVLSGDLSGNDGSNFANNAENVYHVMAANAITAETTLDGFVITGGNANLTSAFLGMVHGHQYGGGLISSQVNTKLTVTRCIFKGNYAGFGGGALQLYYSEPAITGCVFTENRVGNSYGGAVYFDHGSPLISNSIFAANKSNYEGGAMYVFNYSSPVIVNSTFTGNYADVNGGAVYVRNSCTVNVKNAIIWGNTGGGAQAIANEGTASISVTYSDVQGGYTGTGNINADPAFNRAWDADGADNLWRTADDGLALRAASAAANTGSNAAIPAGITTDILGNARILNTTVNMGAYEALLPAVRYYVRAAASGSNDGSSWSNAFTNLQSAIDVAVGGDEIWVAAGTYKPAKDITGSATPANPRTKTFLIRNGVKLYGGFAGTESSLVERDVVSNPTVLSGDLNGNDGSNFANNGENAYHVVAASAIVSPTVLDGFIITAGNANLTSAYLGMVHGHQYGGGLISSQVNTNLTVTRCIFRGNYAGFGGGAMQLYYSEPAITGCVFTGNSVGNSYGGAMYFEHGSPVISNSVFAGNRSHYQGGALYVFNYSSPVIVNTTFTNNSSSYEGGAVYVRNTCTVNIKNGILWNNGSSTQAIANEGTATISITYSDVQGGYAGTGNINADPAFANGSDADGYDNVWFTRDDGLALWSHSPAANTGSNAAIPAGITTDMLGNNRILNTTVNMGAYEFLRSPATVSFSNTTQVYDGTAKYVSFTTDPASLPAFISYRKDGQEVSAPTEAGEYQVTAFINDDIYSGTATGVLTIGKATASIHFSNLVHTYDGLGKSADVSTTPSDLDVTVVYSKDGEELAPTDAGTYEVTAIIQDNNYQGTAVETLTINKALAVLTVSRLEHVYDGTVKSVTAASVPENLEGITLTFRRDGNIISQPLNAGSYEVEATLVNTNYQANTVNKTLVIARASQSITFDAITSRTYGDAPFLLEATASSGAPVTYTSSNTAVATVNEDIVTIVGAGTAVITASQAGDQNHTAAANVERTLTVNQKQQSITFDALLERTVGDGSFLIAATASSGLPVTFTSSNPAVASVSGNTITIVGVGTTVIKASQAGNEHYTSAASVERTLTVRKKTQSITFSPLAEKILGETDFQLSATASSGLAISYASSNPEVATVTGNTVTLRGEGETTITASQQGDAQFGAAASVSQKLVVKLVTGIETAYDKLVKVYPNPVIDRITVESTGLGNIFSVFDSFGKEVLQPRALFSEGQRHTLDLAGLGSGVYYLSINTGKEIIIKRIVKK